MPDCISPRGVRAPCPGKTIAPAPGTRGLAAPPPTPPPLALCLSVRRLRRKYDVEAWLWLPFNTLSVTTAGSRPAPASAANTPWSSPSCLSTLYVALFFAPFFAAGRAVWAWTAGRIQGCIKMSLIAGGREEERKRGRELPVH